MNMTEAKAIVGNDWSGRSTNDARLPQAVAKLGMTLENYKRLFREARRVEVGRHGRCVLTPSGRGRR